MRLDRRRIARVAARWTTELVVVFVGVYGAFAVAEWDETREREERARQVRSALAEEVLSIQRITHRVATNMPRQLARMDSLMAAGTPFPLEPQLEAIGFRPHVWDASMASGALSLLDVETFYLASLFYNGLSAGFEQIAQLRELSQDVLLPIADAPPATFFQPADGGAVALKPQYAWYLYGLRRLGSQARCIAVLGDSLLPRLGAARDTTLAPLDPAGC